MKFLLRGERHAPWLSAKASSSRWRVINPHIRCEDIWLGPKNRGRKGRKQGGRGTDLIVYFHQFTDLDTGGLSCENYCKLALKNAKLR